VRQSKWAHAVSLLQGASPQDDGTREIRALQACFTGHRIRSVAMDAKGSSHVMCRIDSVSTGYRLMVAVPLDRRRRPD
jgi:hypothetical protein